MGIGNMSDDHKTGAQANWRGNTPRKGIFVGHGKGKIVTKYVAKSVRPNRRPRRANAATKRVRDVIAEVAGLAPYEKRLLEVLKTGGANAEKKTVQDGEASAGNAHTGTKKEGSDQEVCTGDGEEGLEVNESYCMTFNFYKFKPVFGQK